MSGSVIVMDNGSGSCKGGFAGEDKPAAIVPTIVGYSKDESAKEDGAPLKATFIGEDALHKGGVLSLKYPIHRGIVDDWDDMEKVWDFMFTSALKVNPKDHTVLVTGSAEDNTKNRNKMYEILFEKFQVAGMQVAVDAVLSLWASGRKTGIVCSCGDSLSHIVPIYEGVLLSEAMVGLNLGGRDLDSCLAQLLSEKGYSFIPQEKYASTLLKDVREKHSYVTLDFEKEMNLSASSLEQNHTFSDGKNIVLDKERFRCTEPLFEPELLGIETPGLHDLVYSSIMKCDMDVRKDLYHNVVLAGGVTMTAGFGERLKNGLASLAPPSINIQISAPSDRAFSAWVGGSILASSDAFSNQILSLQQYKESGLDNIPLFSGIF